MTRRTMRIDDLDSALIKAELSIKKAWYDTIDIARWAMDNPDSEVASLIRSLHKTSGLLLEAYKSIDAIVYINNIPTNNGE